MTRGKSTETAMLEGGPGAAGLRPAGADARADARFAELCGPEGADDEESADDHPGYGSLLGLGVRKQAKKPVIVLDPEVAEQAAQVMEINAGQLVVRGGQPAHGFGALGLGALGEDEDGEPLEAFDDVDAPDGAYADDDEELDPAVAEWAARVPGSDDEGIDEAAEAVWPDQESVEPEEPYEPPVEAAEAWDEEPVVEDLPIEEALVEDTPVEEAIAEEPAQEEPLHEEAVVEQAWLEWARALLEPAQVAHSEALLADEVDEPDELPEPREALSHPVEDLEPAEPELPKHELRQLLAQLSHPRPSRHLWQRLLALLKRIFA